MSQIEFTIAKDVVIAIAAFFGMGLGIYNFWHERQKDKVKLKIVPKSVKQQSKNSLGQEYILTTSNEFNPAHRTDLYAFEIINLSKFDVTIDEVGFLNTKTNGRNSIVSPILRDNGSWPRKLEPRESCTLYASLSSIKNIPHLKNVYTAFAKTTCEHIEEGTSESLTQLVEYANNKA